MKHIYDIWKQEFMSTSLSKRPIYGIYRGIMMKNNQFVSYSQIKSGLTLFFAKRRVNDDGVSTESFLISSQFSYHKTFNIFLMMIIGFIQSPLQDWPIYF